MPVYPGYCSFPYATALKHVPKEETTPRPFVAFPPCPTDLEKLSVAAWPSIMIARGLTPFGTRRCSPTMSSTSDFQVDK